MKKINMYEPRNRKVPYMEAKILADQARLDHAEDMAHKWEKRWGGSPPTKKRNANRKTSTEAGRGKFKAKFKSKQRYAEKKKHGGKGSSGVATTIVNGSAPAKAPCREYRPSRPLQLKRLRPDHISNFGRKVASNEVKEFNEKYAAFRGEQYVALKDQLANEELAHEFAKLNAA